MAEVAKRNWVSRSLPYIWLGSIMKFDNQVHLFDGYIRLIFCRWGILIEESEFGFWGMWNNIVEMQYSVMFISTFLWEK